MRSNNTNNINWLNRAIYQFVLLPLLVIVGFIVSVVMILLSPLLLLLGLGAFKLWMRRINKRAQAWQGSQSRFVKSYTVETVDPPGQDDETPQLPEDF